MKARWLIAMTLVSFGANAADALRDVADVQRELVETAFKSNLALQRESIDVDRASAALDQARARFLPELAFEARYTRADGGRELVFPAGSLLNPAYQTLNELLVGQGQPPRFGQLTDPSIAFQRTHEQDTRVTLRQPLYQPAIPAAVAAQRQLLRGAEYQRVVHGRQLYHDVSIGYLRHLKALRAARIVASAGEVLDENVRVTESLFRNGRITEDQVLRARAERLAVTQQQREARDAIAQSRRYVNFLLNRALDTPLEDARIEVSTTAAPDAGPLRAGHGARRAELARLDALESAAQAQVRVARAALKPSLALGIDAGTQGENYRFGPGYNFIAGSLVLSWKFFDGGARRSALDQARLAARSASLAREELALAIALEVETAADALSTSIDSLDTARAREDAAGAALRIAGRKRDEGAISQVEFMDARQSLTAAALNLNLTQFDLLERRAELERATGTAELPALPVETSR
ncbi:MAG: TolC family protein [Steroidobacteraceae bacterium]